MSFDMLDNLLQRQKNIMESMQGKDGFNPIEHSNAHAKPETEKKKLSNFISLEELTQPFNIVPKIKIEKPLPENSDFHALFAEHHARFKEQEELQEELQEEKKSKAAIRTGDLIFYITLIIIFVVGMASILSENANRNIFGFSFYEVVSGSMQREIPQGSLVVVRKANPAKIQIGDDITFETGNDKLTHRVVGIIENYEGGGQRGFETKGLENPVPDKEIVSAEKVVGKVLFHIPRAGSMAAFAKDRWHITLISFAALTIAMLLLKYAFKKDSHEYQQKETSYKVSKQFGLNKA